MVATHLQRAWDTFRVRRAAIRARGTTVLTKVGKRTSVKEGDRPSGVFAGDRRSDFVC